MIKFHQHSPDFPGYLGGLTFVLENDETIEIGPNTNTESKSINLKQGQYWVGGKSGNSH